MRRFKLLGTLSAVILALLVLAPGHTQESFLEGGFVRGQDGSLWVVGNGVRHGLDVVDDSAGILTAWPEGERAATLGQLNALLAPQPAPTLAEAAPEPIPAPTPASTPDPTPAPTSPPSNPAAGLVGQTAGNLCGIISKSRFTATVQRAEWLKTAGGQTASGMWVIVVANVRNDGTVPDDPFRVMNLRDERGRTFSSASLSDFPPYFDLLRQYDARSDVTDIQPGLSTRSLFIYEIPETVQQLTLVPAETTRCRA